MRRRRGIMGLNGRASTRVITATATGNPLSFITDMVRPLKSLEIPFTPIQAGSGDPSPDNVRPISGWSGCEINHVLNLFDTSDTDVIPNSFYNNSGSIVPSPPDMPIDIYTQYVPVAPNTSYVVSGVSDDPHYIRVAEFNASKVFLKRALTSQVKNPSITITTGSNTRYLRINPDRVVSGISVIDPTQSQTISIAFTDPSTGNPITVYGGTLDVLTGVLTVTMAIVDLGSLNWIDDLANGRAYTTDLASTIKQLAGNMSLVSSALYPVAGYKLVVANAGTMWESGSGNISVNAQNYSTIKEFKTAMSGVQLCYELATPQTYHFDNIGQLITFIGTNTIWTDTNGTNTATYLKHQS